MSLLAKLRATAWRYGLPRSKADYGKCDRCGKTISPYQGVMWVQIVGPFGAKAVQKVHGLCGDGWGMELKRGERP